MLNQLLKYKNLMGPYWALHNTVRGLQSDEYYLHDTVWKAYLVNPMMQYALDVTGWIRYIIILVASGPTFIFVSMLHFANENFV